MTIYEAVQEVTERSKYDDFMGRGSTFWADLIRNIMERLERFFDSLEFNYIGGDYNINAFSRIFAIFGIVLFMVTAIILIRIVLKTRQQDYDLGDIFEELANNKYTVSELIQLALSSESQRLGIRYSFIAVLLHFNETGLIEIKPSATTGIVLAQIKNEANELYVPFEYISNIYHRAWYGKKHIDEKEHEKFMETVRGLISTTVFYDYKTKTQ